MRPLFLFLQHREDAVSFHAPVHAAGEFLGASCAEQAIVGEIGELIIGKASGRQGDAEITLFKSLGIAVEDLACAHWLYARAKRAKVGKTVAFGA